MNLKEFSSRVALLLLIVTLVVAGSANTAFAVPLLQLYIEGATYNGDETWVLSSAGSFTLWVMGNVNGPGGKGPITDVTLYAAFPDTVPDGATISLTPTTVSLGGWTDFAAPGAPSGSPATSPGTPSTTVPDGLKGHSVYGKASTNEWVSFGLGDFTAETDSIADLIVPGCDPTNVGDCDVSAKAGQINAYTVSFTGFPVSSFIHFDATGTITKTDNKGNITEDLVFAPFSHDAQANVVPEPGSLLLLGSGLAGLGLWKRSRRKGLDS